MNTALPRRDDGFTLVEVLAAIVLAMMVTTLITNTIVVGLQQTRAITARADARAATEVFDAASYVALSRATGVQAVSGANPTERATVQVSVADGDRCYTWVATSTDSSLEWKTGVYPAGTACEPTLPTTGPGITWTAPRTQDRGATFTLLDVTGQPVTGVDRVSLDRVAAIQITRPRDNRPGSGAVTTVRALPVTNAAVNESTAP